MVFKYSGQFLYQSPINALVVQFVTDGADFYRDHLLQSSSYTIYIQKLGEIIVIPKDYDTFLKMLQEDIQGAKTHVYLGVLYDYEKGFGKFHESKEVLEGENPFGVDILNKKWSFGEKYSYHLLLFQQVETIIKFKALKF